mgnify:CR=1 FL=1
MNWKLIEDKSWCSLEQQFEWVREMNTVQQDIRYHAEGSVAEHTRMVLEALQQSSAYHSLSTLQKRRVHCPHYFIPGLSCSIPYPGTDCIFSPVPWITCLADGEA